MKRIQFENFGTAMSQEEMKNVCGGYGICYFPNGSQGRLSALGCW